MGISGFYVKNLGYKSVEITIEIIDGMNFVQFRQPYTPNKAVFKLDFD